MATIAVSRIEPRSTKLVASPSHTAAVVALFLILAVSGAFFQWQARSEPEVLLQHTHVVRLYLSLILMEWGLVFWVWKGLESTGTKLTDLVGARWTSAKSVFADAALALGLWGTWTLVQMAWSRWLGSATLLLFRRCCRGEPPKYFYGSGFRSAQESAKSWSFGATSRGNSRHLRTAGGLR